MSQEKKIVDKVKKNIYSEPIHLDLNGGSRLIIFSLLCPDA